MRGGAPGGREGSIEIGGGSLPHSFSKARRVAAERRQQKAAIKSSNHRHHHHFCFWGLAGIILLEFLPLWSPPFSLYATQIHSIRPSVTKRRRGKAVKDAYHHNSSASSAALVLGGSGCPPRRHSLGTRRSEICHPTPQQVQQLI